MGDDVIVCRVLGKYLMYADSKDVDIVPHLCFDGYWEPWVTIAIARALRPGSWCVDVGANHGYFSVIMADGAGREGFVLAVEPNPRLTPLLRATLIANGMEHHTSVVQKAAWRTSHEPMDLVIPGGRSGGGSLTEKRKAEDIIESVATTTLDELTEGWPRVDLVKIDAEGAEYAIWEGMSEVLSRNEELTILLEMNAERQPDASSFLDGITSTGFELREVDPLGEIRPVARREILGGRQNEDMMLLLKRSHDRRRLRRPAVDGFDASLPMNKACNLEDFEHPELVSVIRAVFSYEVERRGSQFPRGLEHRKFWEVAMAVRALSELGALHQDAEILGVGAGTEVTIFWLTRLVRRVFATDLYLDPGTWEGAASSAMLSEPESFAPFDWNPRRLVVQHMNALELRYDDESFDGIFSSSSIEHFGTPEDVERAAGEMFRVLKPGGVLSLATELRVEGPSPGLPGTLLFDEGELVDRIVGDRQWSLVSPLDLSLSAATRATEVLFDDVVAGNAGLPHIVLRQGELVWTSVHIALLKPS